MALSVIKQGLSIFGDVDDTPVDGATKKGVSSNWAYDHKAALDAHTKNPLEVVRIGDYYYPWLAAAPTTRVLTANQLWAFVFQIPRAMTFDRIAIKVDTAVADMSARLGIYNDNGSLYPSSLVLDAGDRKSVV